MTLENLKIDTIEKEKETRKKSKEEILKEGSSKYDLDKQDKREEKDKYALELGDEVYFEGNIYKVSHLWEERPPIKRINATTGKYEMQKLDRSVELVHNNGIGREIVGTTEDAIVKITDENRSKIEGLIKYKNK